MPETTILIVDDEPGIAHLCERLLARSGYGVRAVTNPHRALTELDSFRADLLLVDIRMPGMDGFQLMQAARRKQPHLAVVIMTGFGTVETAVEALRLGADGLILKPFSSGAELVESVGYALEAHRRKRDALRLQALRPLFEVSRRLFAETEPEKLHALLLDAICEHLGCAHAGVYFFPAEEAPQKVAGRGRIPDPEALRAALSAVSLPVLVQAEAAEGALSDLLRAQEYASLACAQVDTQRGGMVLLAAAPADASALSEADLELLVVLAHQGAVALENARLYAELRAYIRRVEESQKLLVQAEKMATAGRLTASIAHEINNPLQGVRNCLHLASRGELSAQERQEYLQLAREELDRLMTTVQRMLDFYRPAAVERRPADLHDLIDRVARLLRREMEQRGVHLHLDLAEDMPYPPVVRDQIQQVLLNLVLNAIEAMPEGGDLRIETRYDAQEVYVSVSDSGPGIDASVRAQIFEPFFSTKENGSGLGLTVCDGIITAHGGRLEVLEQPRGACFRFALPLDPPAPPQQEASPHDPFTRQEDIP